MPRPNPIPTPAQQEASRVNGAKGGRPAKDSAERAALRRKRARELGQRESLNNLKFWLWVRNNGRLPIETRMSASIQIENRYGQPPQSVNITAELESDAPKMFEFSEDFKPPQGWTDQPEGAAVQPETVQ